MSVSSPTPGSWPAPLQTPVMKGVASRFEVFDQKLVNMQPLDPEEQELYDRGVEISAKTEWLEQSLEKMLKDGQ
eukprot:1189087-Prorocentrum_minimum.AAC.6